MSKKHNEYMKKWRKTEKGIASITRTLKKHGKEYKEQERKYRKTEKGKEMRRKIRIKYKAKRKKMGFHRISLPLSVPFDWHHVNKNDVVAISRDIHHYIYHRCGDGKLEGVIG